MGKLISKTYGNGVTETINYNIQGWQTSTEVTNGSTNIYSQSLKYYNPAKGTTPLYTGNISEWSTTLAGYQTNTYGFEYDKLSRLKNTNSYIGTGTTPVNSYTERGITYDMNGNITTLSRYSASAGTPQDSYTYTYEGNRLVSITGTNDNATIADATYTYDSNGNMTKDGLKNLQISYNFLNLPSVVNQSSAEIAKYSWFADGSKYSVLDNSNNGYCYIGSLIYASNNGNLQIESTDFAGGRINLVENTSTNALSQDIQYHHKDHLGSVRAITDNSGSVIEQNAYYPFGSRHTFGNTYAQTTNRFKFNGKEEQTTGNLNYLDYGARMYDANIGRWITQDPLAEKYYSQSPYNYCGGNPVLRIDYEGKFWETAWDAASLTMGLKSLINNIREGNVGAAIADGVGVIIDAAAAVTPFVPGGVSAAISAVRVVDKVDDVVDAGKALNIVDNAANATKIVDRTEDVSSGAAKAAGNTGQYSVYTGMDADGNVKYVGITGRDPQIRFNEHMKSGTNRAKLDYEVHNNLTGLTKTEARIQEQLLINQHGLEKDGGQLYNKINSISPKKWEQCRIK